ncbi:class I SAM-dependent methyltransferase [Streptomyces xanthophaeus]|uniref:Methyltransferase domain-containing protein n=1 Tax=Streptomyces xanthophaeus TaxID=67385 RepID=A0A919GS21_9ACTN|nr:class I SAM-dependent methyltransferase [Streptomyces xanthophaeus]WST20041.1 class I SAM-dependent methyltransferase [Streptomyces xanthophaeus]WST64975.1 class I SAM-dependent methyltransferase [Streptomyces xanthophaeus]GHI82860.1 hypothetical protein Sxan_02240 [Streptomyces xanthophaeus]
MDSTAWSTLVLVGRSLPAVCGRTGVVRGLRLALSEVWFDLRHHTDTRMEPPRHEGTNPLVFAEVVAHLPSTARRGRFLDFGAGKGRALLLAASDGFTAVTGVEREGDLCRVAVANAARRQRRFPGATVEVCHGDVLDFAVPDDVSVGFFFNPFGPDVLEIVIGRILDSLGRAPRPFHVVYLHPRHAELFLGAGFTLLYAQGMDGLILRHGR